jgi:hypothetical protein
MRLKLISNCFPNKDTNEDNGDVFWHIVEEDNTSESEVMPGETQIKSVLEFLFCSISSELEFEHLVNPSIVSPECYIIMWGSDNAAFPTSRGELFNTVYDLHTGMSGMYLSHPFL